ncbi:Outer membrane usher protein YraJ [Escherichia coli]|nr:Outer membrane usher protein YraJ [Escherichia coli]
MVLILAWRLRNYSTWTRNDQTSSWNTISSYLQRDIKALKSQLLLGESATSGSIFSSYTFTGVQLASDDNMLPNSQRGFAPTVRGIANSSAIVTIRQNGYVIIKATCQRVPLKLTISTPLPTAAI